MSSSNSNGGIGVLGILGVAFVILKLMGYITWSWWYVTMPFWGGPALLAIVVFVAFLIYVSLKLLS